MHSFERTELAVFVESGGQFRFTISMRIQLTTIRIISLSYVSTVIEIRKFEGGFDRKLNSSQIRRYKDDWLSRVANKRELEHGPLELQPQLDLRQLLRIEKRVQFKESSDEHLYSIDAEYPLFASTASKHDKELNERISTFITNVVDDFRAAAIANADKKTKLQQEFPTMCWDSLFITSRVFLNSPDYLSIEFVFQTYGAGAAHPNSLTRTLTFGLKPFRGIELGDLFVPASDYLRILSDYCIEELHKMQPHRWNDPSERAERLKLRRDEWIMSGAGAQYDNFRPFLLANEGILVFFDAYKVGSYAEGRYEVFVPFHLLRPCLRKEILNALP
jgi:hypothetical protein